MKLIVTVGLPRSGKSTWAREQGLPIVCPDAIRLAMHGERFLGKAEPWVWAFVFTMVEALFLAGNETVIIDATNTTKKRRDEWYSKFPKAEVKFKMFATSPEECKKRALLTGQSDLLPVIKRMAEQWDLPRPKEWADSDIVTLHCTAGPWKQPLCAKGCKGMEIEPGVFSGCSCPDEMLANGLLAPAGFVCDCPNHPKAA